MIKIPYGTSPQESRQTAPAFVRQNCALRHFGVDIRSVMRKAYGKWGTHNDFRLTIDYWRLSMEQRA